MKVGDTTLEIFAKNTPWYLFNKHAKNYLGCEKYINGHKNLKGRVLEDINDELRELGKL